MILKISVVLSTFLCSLALGTGLASSWFGIIELVGIAALIGCIVLPLQDEFNWLSRLKMSLFWLGIVTTLISIFATSYVQFDSFLGWLMVVCLWTSLSGFLNEWSNSFNRLQLTLVLYNLVTLGLGLGYWGSTYFNW